MPKGKKKGKFEHRRTEQPYSSDEDAGIDMTIDNCSETSGQSDLKSNHEEAGFVNEGENICCFDAELEDALNTHLTYGHVYPDLEDEWDTDNDSDSHLEDPHVEVSHQGRPSTFVDTDLQVILAPELNPQDQNEAQEKLEEKVLELVEALNARAAAARAAAFDGLRAALQRRAFPVLAGHRATLADHVTRALRRGREAERRAAAALVPILSLQIGEEGTEEFMNEVRPALVAGCTDKTSSLDTRSECCSSLAALCYLLEDDVSEMLAVLHMFETIFSGSYLKGDGSVKVSAGVVAEGGWHAAALDGWALLLPALPPPLAPPPARLAELLDAASLEVRMAAGVALAVAHERVADTADDAPGWAAAELRARLARLATDPHKYRAKRDRKLQRATFRDVLKYFEEGEVPELRVRVGVETIECDTWAARGAYGALAAALGAGLRPLAAASGALRAALGLPAASPLAPPAAKLNKLQRHLQNSAACKARTVARNKNRDKRSAALAI